MSKRSKGWRALPTAVEILYLVCIAHVWSRGTIFQWLRTHGPNVWVLLADCPFCSGFWIGVLGHLIYRDRPMVIVWLGTGSIVATGTLALCAAIRRL